jgi:S-DNA-T family DNA segregation ATPase FtsK/SpoIIIE
MPSLNELSPHDKAVVLKLLQKFVSYNIIAPYSTVSEGPVVTGYYFTIAGSTKISDISARLEDFALALGVDSVSIDRVGPNIVLYVPNKNRLIVDFKDYLYWYLKDDQVYSTILPIPLGINPSGAKSVLSLAECPHILIAGQTGAGKSILLSSIITCLSAKYPSEELKFFLVDTKQVDLPLFKTLPHVKECAKNVDEFFKIMALLYSHCKQRLIVLSAAGARNIKEYKQKTGKNISYLVLVIDELANLIEEDNMKREEIKQSNQGLKPNKREEIPPSVSQVLKSLSQISRAAGIHIIAGTQRSSVKIINGDIKANFPCRIALKLPAQVDSRCILDEGGAENLLGKGDMLIKQPDHDLLQRYHSPFVRLEDIEYIVHNLTEVKSFL